jgi:sugar lactone lactonase YvrE
MSKPSVSPRTWRPQRAPGLTGVYARNDALAGLERWEVPGVGPEDVAVDSQGRVYTGTGNGQILRISRQGGRIERIAETNGRPLGIEIDADGMLVVCDAHRGLLRVDPEVGSVRSLARELDGRPFVFTNNCDVAADGSIYFTDSSTRFPVEHFKADILEHSGTGRLLRWSPDGSVDVLLGGLDFANGVALAEDDSFVLVAETGGYRVTRLWLTGPRAGGNEVLIDNLPGFPDNLATGSNGIFWIAMPSERNALLDRLLPLPGALRKAVWALPEALQPDATRSVFVLGIDANGAVVHNLQAPADSYHYVTGVREHDGHLYLGSLMDSAVARVALPG